MSLSLEDKSKEVHLITGFDSAESSQEMSLSIEEELQEVNLMTELNGLNLNPEGQVVDMTDRGISEVKEVNAHGLMLNEVDLLVSPCNEDVLSSEIDEISPISSGLAIEIDDVSNQVNHEEFQNQYDDFKSFSCSYNTLYTLMMKLGYSEGTCDWSAIDEKISDIEIELRKEDLFSGKIRESLANLRNANHKKDRNGCFICMKIILDEILPLNIRTVKRLYDEASARIVNIPDSEVVNLTFGETGGGKSTTILFLAGSKMQRVTVNGLSHITGVEHALPGMESVVTSPFAKSETRYLNPITIPPSNRRGKEFIILDTAGIGDTRGSIIDIVNGLTLKEGLHKFKSFKMLVFLPYTNFGARGEGVENLSHILAHSVDVTDENIMSSIIYIFTRFPESEKNVHAKLNDIFNCRKAENSSIFDLDNSFGIVLEDMIEKSDPNAKYCGVFVLNPLTDNPATIISAANRLHPISNPVENFSISISDKTKHAITLQLSRTINSLRAALKHMDLPLLQYHIGTLMNFNTILRDSATEDAIVTARSYTYSYLRERFDQCFKPVKKMIIYDKSIDSSDIREFQKFCSEFLKENFLESFLDEDAFSASQSLLELTHVFQDKLQRTFDNIRERNEVDVSNLKILFGNLQVCSSLDESLLKLYENAMEDLLLICNSKSEQFIASLTNFEKISDISIILRMLRDLQSVFNSNKNISFFNSCAIAVLNHYWSISTSIVRSMRHLSKLRIDTFCEQLDRIRTAKNCVILNSSLQNYADSVPKSDSTDDASTSADDLSLSIFNSSTLTTQSQGQGQMPFSIVSMFDYVMDHLVSIYSDRIKSFDTKSSLSVLHTFMKEFQMLQVNCQEFEMRTIALYYQFDGIMQRLISKIPEDVENMLSQLQTANVINHQKLVVFLANVYKNKDWIESEYPELYERMNSEIEDHILLFCASVKESIRYFDMSIHNPNSVDQALKLINDIDRFHALSKYFPDLTEGLENDKNIVTECITKELNTISTLFRFDEAFYEKIRSDLSMHKRNLNQYYSYSAVTTLLKVNDFDSMEEVYATKDDLCRELETEMREIKVSKEVAETERLLQIQNKFNELRSTVNTFEAMKHLKNNKILNAKDLNTQISVMSAKVAKFDVKIKSIQEQLNRIEVILAQCKELVSSNVVTQLQIKFLDNKCMTLDQLKFTIDELETKLNSSTDKYQCCRSTVEIKRAFDSLGFLARFESSRHLMICKQANEIKNSHMTFLREYCDWLGKSISESIDQIAKQMTTYSPSVDVANLVTSVTNFLQLLFEFKKFDINFTTNASELCTKNCNQLDGLQTQLNSLMEQTYQVGNSIHAQSLIKLAFDLIYFDPYLSNEKNFKLLYNRHTTSLQNSIGDHCRDIWSCLSEKSYELLPDLLSRYNSQLPVDQRNRISNHICTAVKRVMKELQRLTVSLKSQLHLEQSKEAILILKSTVDTLCIFRQETVQTHILDRKVVDDVNNFLTTFQNSFVIEAVNLGIQASKSLMNQNNFLEAIQASKCISLFIVEFEDFCTKQQEEDLKLLEAAISESISKTKEFTFSQFPSEYPKVYVEKLQRVATIGIPNAATAIEYAKEGIRNVVLAEINNIETMELSHENRYSKIAKIKHMLTFVPEEIASEGSLHLSDLETKINRIQSTENTLVDDCKKAIDTDDIVLSWRMYKELKVVDSKRLSDVISHLNRRIQTKVPVIKQCFSRGQYEEMFDDFLLLCEYKNIWVDSESPITDAYRQIIDFLSSYFDASLNVLKSCDSEHFSNVQRHLSNIFVFMNYSNDKRHDILSEFKLMDKFNSTLHSLSDHIISLSTFEYDINIHDVTTLDVNRLFLWFKTIESWNDVTQSIVSFASTNAIIESLLKSDVPKYCNTKSALEYVCGIVENVKDKVVSIDFGNSDFLSYDCDCEDIISMNLNSISKISTLNTKFNTLLMLHLHKDISTELEEMKNHIITAFANFGEQLHKSLIKILEIPNDVSFKSFRSFYKPMSIFMKLNRNGIIREANVTECLTKTENNVMSKMYQIKEDTILKGKSKDIVQVASLLVEMKHYARELFMFSVEINKVIDSVISHLRKLFSADENTYLITELEKTEYGNEIISEHSDFAAVDLRNKREVMQNQDNIKYVLESLDGSDLDTKSLRSKFESYEKKYKSLLSIVLKLKLASSEEGIIDASQLVDMIIHDASKLRIIQKEKIVWSSVVTNSLPDMIAMISALITLLKSPRSKGTADSKNVTLLKPHAAQIISIFRMLGIGYTKVTSTTAAKTLSSAFSTTKVDGLNNNLVEVKTGEGKSLILAIVASVFAVYGIDVDISCYSEYLSKRDREDYECLFRALKIESRITYGTFNHLCEKLLNERVNVRDVMSDMIKNNKEISSEVSSKAKVFNPKIILIDEVDVFISDKFFGAKYYPSFILNDSSLFALQKEMWSSRKTVMKFTTVKQITDLASFKACQAKFSNYATLLIEAAKDMVSALSTFEKFSSKHIVVEDILKCVQSDSVIEGANYGYNTLWNYFLENDKGNISEKSLQDNTGVIIDCGTISFAEMPHQFTYISGVTGTLKTLANAEKSILKDIYGIAHFTYMPSVFGDSNRKFEKSHHVVVVDKENYYLRLRTEIDNFRAMERPVLVFFESEAKMLEFYKSTNLSDIHTTVNTITERHSEDERNLLVKQATSAGRITLLPRVFGRGTDFICRSKAVLSAGGVHVIQTFFSPEKSEEIQIQGRCARQGSFGSYCQILLDSDLEWILGCDWRTRVIEIRAALYDKIDSMRTDMYESSCKGKYICIDSCKISHHETIKFMSALATNNLKSAMDFIISQNKGAELVNKRSRTLILLDATGSMSSMLAMAKDTICTVFARVFDILKKQGLDPDNFLVQFAVYRDYDCGLEGVLQMSNWESKPEQLEKFMDPSNVEAEGGDDYEEAIEIGLLHAVREAQSGGLTQVIVIGDAPAKEFDVIKAYREKYGGGESAWGKKFGPPTHYSDQLQTLLDKKVAVHSFYLANGARECFEDIGKTGKCEYLDLKSAGGGVNQFLNFVTQEILRKSAGDKGEEAVLLYEKTYIRHTK